jgi:hypothetical protein
MQVQTHSYRDALVSEMVFKVVLDGRSHVEDRTDVVLL